MHQMSMKKRRRVAVLGLSPPAVDDSQDAPTIRLENSAIAQIVSAHEEDEMSSSFAQLGSVMGKLESFNAASNHRRVKTLSTVPSESVALVKVEEEKDGDWVETLKNFDGISDKLLIESSSSQLESKFDPFFDNFNTHSFSSAHSALLKQALASFTLQFLENSLCWGVIRIPRPFGFAATIVCNCSESGKRVVITGLNPNNAFFSEMGIEFVAVVSSKTESDEESSVQQYILQGKANIFGFFDYLRSCEILADPRKQILLLSSLPFRHSVFTCPEVHVKPAAALSSGFLAQIDNLHFPLSQLDDILTLNFSHSVKATIGVDIHSMTTPFKDGVIKLVKRFS